MQNLGRSFVFEVGPNAKKGTELKNVKVCTICQDFILSFEFKFNIVVQS